MCHVYKFSFGLSLHLFSINNNMSGSFGTAASLCKSAEITCLEEKMNQFEVIGDPDSYMKALLEYIR